MIYIFAIIFSVIQCNTVKYNINRYTSSGKLAYSINNSEKIEISSFNEYLYSKTLELDVSKYYDFYLYFYRYSGGDEHWVTTSKELMQLEEYYKVKKNNNDFNIMFSPKGFLVDDAQKFYQFLKNNNFPKILILLTFKSEHYIYSKIDIYYSYNICFLKNEFILVDYSLESDTLIFFQLYSLEKHMMFYIYNTNHRTGLINIDSPEYAKFILDYVNKTEDNREQFKSIPKVFIIAGKYKLNSISTSIFVKAGFSYSYLDSENYYLIFFKTNANFQPIKTKVKEYNSTITNNFNSYKINSTYFFSITTFGENNLEITK